MSEHPDDPAVPSIEMNPKNTAPPTSSADHGGAGLEFVDVEDVKDSTHAASVALTLEPFDPVALGGPSAPFAQPAAQSQSQSQSQAPPFGGGAGGDGPTVYAKTQSYMSNRGLGWLFEVDDEEDEDMQLSLIEELDIDPKDILVKVRAVIMPYKRTGEDSCRLTEPDFWGPFFVVLGYAISIVWGQWQAVSWTFSIWFFGSMLLYIIHRFLGSPFTYSQILSAVGYCVIPLVACAPLVTILIQLSVVGHIATIFGIGWASYAAGNFLIHSSVEHKRILLMFPILLIYIYFGSIQSGV